MSPDLIDLSYLLAASLFIIGLKGLTKPRTAVRGNLLGALASSVLRVEPLALGRSERAPQRLGLSRQLPHSSLDSFAVRCPAGQGVVRTNGDPSAA